MENEFDTKDRLDTEVIKYIKRVDGNPQLRIFRDRHCTGAFYRNFCSVSPPTQHVFYISNCVKGGGKRYCRFREFRVRADGYYQQCTTCQCRFPLDTLVPMSETVAKLF